MAEVDDPEIIVRYRGNEWEVSLEDLSGEYLKGQMNLNFTPKALKGENGRFVDIKKKQKFASGKTYELEDDPTSVWADGNVREMCRIAVLLSAAIYKGSNEEVLKYLNENSRVLGDINEVTFNEYGDCRFLIAQGKDSKKAYVAFRGSYSVEDWEVNLKMSQKDNPFGPLEGPKGVIHSGFYERAKGFPAQLILTDTSLQDKDFVLCGHSLGGATAMLVAADMMLQRRSLNRALEGHSKVGDVNCVTFGAPMVGDTNFKACCDINSLSEKFFHFVNGEDLVPVILSLLPDESTAIDFVLERLKAILNASESQWAKVSALGIKELQEFKSRPRSYEPFGNFMFAYQKEFPLDETFETVQLRSDEKVEMKRRFDTIGGWNSERVAHPIQNYERVVKSWLGENAQEAGVGRSSSQVRQEKKYLPLVLEGEIVTCQSAKLIRLTLQGANLESVVISECNFDNIFDSTRLSDLVINYDLSSSSITFEQDQWEPCVFNAATVTLATAVGRHEGFIVRRVREMSRQSRTLPEHYYDQPPQLIIDMAMLRCVWMASKLGDMENHDIADALMKLAEKDSDATSNVLGQLLRSEENNLGLMLTSKQKYDDVSAKITESLKRCVQPPKLKLRYMYTISSFARSTARSIATVSSNIGSNIGSSIGRADMGIASFLSRAPGTSSDSDGKDTNTPSKSGGDTDFEMTINKVEGLDLILSALMDLIRTILNLNTDDLSLKSLEKNYALLLGFICKLFLSQGPNTLDDSMNQNQVDAVRDLIGRNTVWSLEAALKRLHEDGISNFPVLNALESSSKEVFLTYVKKLSIIHEIRNCLWKKCFLGIVGKQNAGKSTFIEKLWGLDAGDIGMTKHTEEPRFHQMERRLAVIDFPGSDTLAEYADSFAVCGAMNNVLVMIVPYEGDASRTITDEVMAAYRLSGGQIYAKIILCINKCGEDMKLPNVLDLELADKGATRPERLAYFKAQYVKSINDYYERIESEIRVKEDSIFFTDWKLDAAVREMYGIFGPQDIADEIKRHLIKVNIFQEDERVLLDRCFSPEYSRRQTNT